MLTLNIVPSPHKAIDQTWSIERIAKEAPPRTWEKVFADAAPELHDASIALGEKESLYGPYYPLKKDIFAAFNYTPLNNVKVVIFGQDPYHQTVHINNQTLPRAVGMSFSVRLEDSIPSSLNNIYKELENSVRGFKRPDHGDLREWASQGVLLLNQCLTVKPGTAGSHGLDVWMGFINKVLKAIAVANPNCIFLLWGRHAQKLKPLLGERSIIFEASHPSGYSVQKGFFGCNHFNLVNEALIKQGKVGINWRISTRAELKSGPKVAPLPPPALTDHKAQLAPIDVITLSTMIPVKSSPTEKKESPTRITPPLPIIPNINGSSPKQSLPTQTKMELPLITETNPKKVVPTIPQVNFGSTPKPMILSLKVTK